MSNIKIKLDMSSKEQLTAASNFFKELADIAQQPLKRPETREDMQATLKRILQMDVVSEEVPGKPTAPQETAEESPSSDATEESKATSKTAKSGSRKSPKSKTSTKSKKEPAEPEDTDSSQETQDSSETSSTEASKATKSSAKASQKQDEPSKTETPKDLREPLRVLLNQKVDDHRKTIKDELGKYNAKSISNLDVEHHPAFMEFMENLS